MPEGSKGRTASSVTKRNWRLPMPFTTNCQTFSWNSGSNRNVSSILDASSSQCSE